MILTKDDNIILELEVSRDERDSIAQVEIENRTMFIQVTHIEDTADSSKVKTLDDKFTELGGMTAREFLKLATAPDVVK